MAKKVLKKKLQRKPAAAGRPPVVESAREVLQAGLGAISVAQQEGGRIIEQSGKLFDKLVAEGSKLENKARKEVGSAVGDIREGVQSRVAEVRKQAEAARRQATDNWDKLERIFEDRVAGALKRLGIPTRDEVGKLKDSVNRLSHKVAELETRAAAAKPRAKKKARRKAVSAKSVKAAA